MQTVLHKDYKQLNFRLLVISSASSKYISTLNSTLRLLKKQMDQQQQSRRDLLEQVTIQFYR